MFWAISIFFLSTGALLCILSFVLAGTQHEMFWEIYARQQSCGSWAGIFLIVVGYLFLVLGWQLRKQNAIEAAMHRSAEAQNVLREIAETAIYVTFPMKSRKSPTRSLPLSNVKATISRQMSYSAMSTR